MAFDPEDGTLSFVDDKGQPRRLDLRAAEARIASKAKLTSLSTANGSDLYGITPTGDISRITPSGDWAFNPPAPAKRVYPQANGSLIIAGSQAGRTVLWLIRPTDDEILATADLPPDARNGTQVGDRIYFVVDSGLAGVRARDLERVKTIPFKSRVRAVAPTPSGDRVYVALDDNNELSIVDRYAESATGTVDLPGNASDLRMDPLGQNLLVRPSGNGDSAWVVSVGTDKVTGTIRSAWRADLPAFAPGNLIVTARDTDAVLVDAETLAERQTVKGGAADYWYFVRWNGYRPRSQDLDRPVAFEPPADTTAARDSAMGSKSDTALNPPLRDAHPTQVEPPLAAPHARTFMVSFAAVLSEQKANETAQGIVVNGNKPRVVSAQTGSTTIYRVVLGPFTTREEADKVGRDSGRPYWVYEDGQ
jgi:cell division septation protein DedD